MSSSAIRECVVGIDQAMTRVYVGNEGGEQASCCQWFENMDNEPHEPIMPTNRPVGFEVDFPAALQLADIVISCDDLRRAALFLERLISLYSRDEASWTDEVLAEALWTASIIKYARAFDQRGAKAWKLNVSLYNGWDGAAEMHRRFIKIRNCHTAHDHNPLNQCKVGVDISPSPDGAPTMRVCELEIYPSPNFAEVESLYRLVRGGLERIKEVREKQEDKVLEQAKRLSLEHLQCRRVLAVRVARGEQTMGENRVGWPREKIRK